MLWQLRIVGHIPFLAAPELVQTHWRLYLKSVQAFLEPLDRNVAKDS